MNLIDFYKKVLGLGAMHADENGIVRGLAAEKNQAIMLGDQMLVLPVGENLRSSDTKVVFHPLAEDVVVGLNDVCKKLQERINFNLNLTMSQMLTFVGMAALTLKAESGLNSQQLDVLQNISSVPKSSEKKSFDIMRVIGQRFAKQPRNAFVEILLSRGGKYRGERMSRTAVVTFPFYQELVKDLAKPRKDATLGLTKEETEFLIQLHEAILPGIDVPEEYNCGVGVRIAPFFTVLLKTTGGLLNQMMRLKDVFPEFVSLDEDACTDFSFLSILDDQDALSKLSKQFPNLDKIKHPIEKEAEPISASLPTPPAPVAQATPQATPVPNVAYVGAPAAAPTVAKTPKKGERVSFDQWSSTRANRSSPMAMTGAASESIRRHNEAYAAFYAAHMQQYGVPPANMPHPSQIPPNQMAPAFPGMPQPQMPVMPMAPVMGQQGMVPYAGGAMPVPMMGQPGMMPQQPVNMPMYPGMVPQAGYPAPGYGVPMGYGGPWQGYRR